MVFCIDQNKNEKLSEYLSQIIKELKTKEEVDSVIMNSYLIHVPVNSFFDIPGIIDGVNIKLTMICNAEIKETEESVKELKNKILEELNYNVVISTMPADALKLRTNRLNYYINDADIIFDKTGDVTLYKNLIFFESKSEESIEYQPHLNIRS